MSVSSNDARELNRELPEQEVGGVGDRDSHAGSGWRSRLGRIPQFADRRHEARVVGVRPRFMSRARNASLLRWLSFLLVPNAFDDVGCHS